MVISINIYMNNIKYDVNIHSSVVNVWCKFQICGILTFNFIITFGLFFVVIIGKHEDFILECPSVDRMIKNKMSIADMRILPKVETGVIRGDKIRN